MAADNGTVGCCGDRTPFTVGLGGILYGYAALEKCHDNRFQVNVQQQERSRHWCRGRSSTGCYCGVGYCLGYMGEATEEEGVGCGYWACYGD